MHIARRAKCGDDESGGCLPFRAIREWILDPTQMETYAQEVPSTAVSSSLGLDALYEAMPAGLCCLDRNFRYIRVNPSLARMNGLPIDQHLGRTPYEVVPTVAGETEKVFRSVLQSEAPVHFELKGMTPAEPGEERVWDEHWYPIRDDSGVVTGVGVIVQDITQRKLAEQALGEAERRFRASQEASPVGFIILRCVREPGGGIVDFRCEYANRAASLLLGRNTNDLVGRRMLAGRSPIMQDVAGLFACFCSIVHGAQTLDRELQLSLGGSPAWVRNTVVKLDDGVAVSFADITDQVRTREALVKARKAAEHASAAKDRFLAELSHELRTPLAPALIAIESVMLDESLPPAHREQLEVAQRNLVLEVKLLDDLLDLGRVVSGKLHLDLQPVDLTVAVREACRTCEQSAQEKRIRIQHEPGALCRKVRADPARLQQMLWNLLRNAVKFTPEGGHVRIVTTCTAHDLAVSIQDSGIGIDPALIPTIFDAFAQGDAPVSRDSGGLGLGLAITKSLAEQHGGRVTVESTGPGHGATFTLTLPAMVAEEVVQASQPSSAFREDCAALRVLLVEDHLDTAMVIARSLRKRVQGVCVAHEAGEALRLCERESFDVMVSDIGLPDSSGYALMREVTSRFGVAGIAMSGYGMPEDLARSREAGFVEHLVKPIRMQQLMAALQRVAGSRSTPDAHLTAKTDDLGRVSAPLG